MMVMNNKKPNRRNNNRKAKNNKSNSNRKRLKITLILQFISRSRARLKLFVMNVLQFHLR